MPKGNGLRSMRDKQLEDRIAQAIGPNERMDVDELVDALRDVYPEYRRQKKNPFTRRVQDVVEQREADQPPDAELQAAQAIYAQDSVAPMADGPDSVAPSRLNSSITQLYHITAQPANSAPASAPVEAQNNMSSSGGAVPVQPTATLASAQPTSHAVGSSHNGAQPTAPKAQTQQIEINEDANASQLEDEPPVTAKVPKKRSKLYSKGVKRVRDSAGEAGPAAKRASIVTPKRVFYSDLGGIDDVLADIRQLIENPLMHPEVYAWLGVQPPRGVLLYGPPGCGKTALANAIATECGVPFLRISAPEVVSGMSGESEAKVRQLFADAAAAAPSILFIDEIDAIAPKRENAQREMERRIVAQMLTCMDDLAAPPAPVQESDSTVADAAGGGSTIIPQMQGENTNGFGSFGNGSAAAAAASAAAASRHASGASVPHVVVIGATNRPDSLDPALRRAGRFDREISLGIPGESARAEMLRVLCRGLRLGGGVDVCGIARATPGYVGADLSALTKEAAALAVSRTFKDLDASRINPAAVGISAAEDVTPVATTVACDVEMHEPAQLADSERETRPPTEAAERGANKSAALVQEQPNRRQGLRWRAPLTAEELQHVAITGDDFQGALAKVQPSVRREGFSTKPDVTWADVGSLDGVKEELVLSISLPIRHPEYFQALGVAVATGLLLFGPPGCGKTLVAKAAAADCGANFISIKGPELLNKFVGESERAIRSLFFRARSAKPCVVFFDELDALAPQRGGGSDGNHAAERVVNQLLTELDGTESRGDVFVLAATNRPDIIDPALLRPGRLDKTLYVPLPDAAGRGAIFTALCKRSPIEEGVDVRAFASAPDCEGLSGADLASLLREAAVASLKESMRAPRAEPKICARHLEAARRVTRPSVSAAQRMLYERLRDKLLPRSNVSAAAGDAGRSGTSQDRNAKGKGTAPEGNGNQNGAGTSNGDDAMAQPC